MLMICSVLLDVLFILDLFSNLMLPLTYVFSYQAKALPFFNAGAKIGQWVIAFFLLEKPIKL
jgi:hypothetical protein